MRVRVYEVLHLIEPKDRTATWINRSIAFLILLNVTCVVLESMKQVNAMFENLFQVLEIVSLSIFIVEYVARVWSCVEDPRYSGALRGRVRFMFSLFPLFDLLAIVPALFFFQTRLDLRVLRTLRLLRLLRVLKLARYSKALQLLGRVMKDAQDLLLVSLLVLLFLLVTSGGLMYYAENNAQPDRFSSIPASIWYCVVTLTTVGYGDISPVTPVGKLIAGIMAVMGIGLVAIPTGVISSAFLRQIETGKNSDETAAEVLCCPHCQGTFVVDGAGKEATCPVTAMPERGQSDNDEPRS